MQLLRSTDPEQGLCTLQSAVEIELLSTSRQAAGGFAANA